MRSEAGELLPPHREATFPPPRSLPAEGSSQLSLPKWKEHPPLPSPFPQSKIPAGSVRARPREPRFAPGERRLCRRLVQFALRPRGWVLGKLLFCSFGTGCWAARPGLGVSRFVHPLLSSSSSLAAPGRAMAVPGPVLRWVTLVGNQLCLSLGCDDGIFFLPRSHRCLVCSPSTKRICKGIPQNTQNGHLHILLTESVLSFQLIASYDFFLYYKYYINNV